MTNKINASDCKCRECGKQAVAFWPCIELASAIKDFEEGE